MSAAASVGGSVGKAVASSVGVGSGGGGNTGQVLQLDDGVDFTLDNDQSLELE